MTDKRIMRQSFLMAYLDAFQRIEGWFSYDAALMFMAFNQILAKHIALGDVLEIGVHHGLSTIGLTAMRGPGKQLYAVDLFEELQEKNISRSGAGNRVIFEENMERFYSGRMDFVRILGCPSGALTAKELGQAFTFCHVDGGHSRGETYNDLKLCHSVLLPGGIIALDDYFNVEYPGVCEGAVEFMIRQPDALRPLAIGFNKVLFQKRGVGWDLNAEFREAFPHVKHKMVQLWDEPTLLFTSVFRSCFDLQASTPEKFCLAGSIPPRALLVPDAKNLQVRRGDRAFLSVSITNRSVEALPYGDKVFGLSYHLLSDNGQLLKHDNDRTYLKTPLQPGADVVCELPIQAPDEAGNYRLEIDLVWENVFWFRDIGNPTVFVALSVS